jgi:hypothetical protein
LEERRRLTPYRPKPASLLLRRLTPCRPPVMLRLLLEHLRLQWHRLKVAPHRMLNCLLREKSLLSSVRRRMTARRQFQHRLLLSHDLSAFRLARLSHPWCLLHL